MIQKIDIKKVKPNKDNPRRLEQGAFKKLKQSIKDFPEMLNLRPLILDENNVVLGGNMRLKALKELGYEEVPYFKAEDLTEEQKKEFIIKDNVNFGDWDIDMLKEDYDINQLTDWGLDDIKELNEELENELDEEEKERRELIEDEVPEIDDIEIEIKEGDIFQLGNHYLMCGDSTDEDHIKKLLENQNKDVLTHCISDPPYGISYKPKKAESIQSYNGGNIKTGMIKNDDVILDYISLGMKYTNGFFALWTGYQVVDKWIKLMKKHLKNINNMIIWQKGGGGLGDTVRTLAQDYEILLVNHRGNFLKGEKRGGAFWEWTKEEKKEKIKDMKTNELKEILLRLLDESIWKVGKDHSHSYLHPTQKPIGINEKVLLNFTTKKDQILDLFGGSGSNLIACEKNDRKMFMMELDPEYVKVILKRFNQYTGGNQEIKCLNRNLDVSTLFNN